MLLCYYAPGRLVYVAFVLFFCRVLTFDCNASQCFPPETLPRRNFSFIHLGRSRFPMQYVWTFLKSLYAMTSRIHFLSPIRVVYRAFCELDKENLSNRIHFSTLGVS